MFNFEGLKNQIAVEEQRALRKKLSVDRRVIETKSVFHEKLTSPKVFASAFASGGVLGWLVTKRKSNSGISNGEEAENSPKPTSESSEIVKNVKRILITFAVKKATEALQHVGSPASDKTSVSNSASKENSTGR